MKYMIMYTLIATYMDDGIVVKDALNCLLTSSDNARALGKEPRYRVRSRHGGLYVRQ